MSCVTWMFTRKTECFRLTQTRTGNPKAGPYLPKLLLCEGKRVHECLGDHWQTAIYVWCLLNVKDKLRVLQDVYPEAKRKAVPRERDTSFQVQPFMWGRCCVYHSLWMGVFVLATEVCKSALPNIPSNRGQHHSEQERVTLSAPWKGGLDKSETGHWQNKNFLHKFIN